MKQTTGRDAIMLSRGKEVWLATSYGPEADRIMQLFGTTTLPTACGVALPELTVLETIARLNPTVDVFGPTLQIIR